MKFEIDRDITVRSETSDVSVSASKTSFLITGYDSNNKAYIDTEDVPEFCKLLMALHAEVTSDRLKEQV